MKRKLLLGRKISPSQSYSAFKFSLSSMFYAIALRNHYISATKLTMNKNLGVLAILKDTRNSFGNDRTTLLLLSDLENNPPN